MFHVHVVKSLKFIYLSLILILLLSDLFGKNSYLALFSFTLTIVFEVVVIYFISCNSFFYVQGLQTTNLKVLNSSMIQDMNSYVHMIGYVKNIGNFTLKDIIINAHIKDSNNVSIGNYSRELELRFLNPSEISPFDVLIFDKHEINKIKKFDFTFDYNISKTHYSKEVKLVSSLSRLDLTGIYYISGKVKNTGYSISNNTIVIASVRDKDDNMLGIWKAQTEPYNIPPYEMASFTIPVTDKNQIIKISKYSLFIN